MVKGAQGGSKRKKHHDKDKYYRLAKEQGLRSRAAFKLSQINRKYHLLENSRIVLDLCAAPGGWTQIASRTMSQSKSRHARNHEITPHVIAVDILPIRAIGPNVTTLVGDVTTAACHAKIRSTVSTHTNTKEGGMVDVVLCDGAPDVGASYDKDAYAQNEIALLSLKCATEHLKRGGSFVTKIYRSGDYTSFLYVVRQLFGEVKPVKPASSRSASSEIFLVCLGYKKPDVIDKRLLDPKTVFEQVDDPATLAAKDEEDGQLLHNAEGGLKTSKKMHIFHKQFDPQSKANRRGGYTNELLDFGMTNIRPVVEFVESGDPIKMLTECTGLSFRMGVGTDSKEVELEQQKLCDGFLNHGATNEDIKACLTDLKVLNKADFKRLLQWRLKMQTHRDILLNKTTDTPMEEDEPAEEPTTSGDGTGTGERDKDADDEEAIQNEIAEMRAKKLRTKKRQLKKLRAEAAKRRSRAAKGMDAVVASGHDTEMFSLATITNVEDLDQVREVDLDKLREKEDEEEDNDEIDMGSDDDEESDEESGDELDEKTGYSYRLDKELDMAYDKYLIETKNKEARSGTKMDKRKKANSKQRAKLQAQEDEDLVEESMGNLDKDTKDYAALLTKGVDGKDESDDSDDDSDNEHDNDSDDGFGAEPMTPEEHAKAKAKKQKAPKQAPKPLVVRKNKPKSTNPLIVTLPEEPTTVKAARWFSNPLFGELGAAAAAATVENDPDEDDDVEDMSSDDEPASTRTTNSSGKKKMVGLDAEEVLASIPKTEKQLRHQRRLKAMKREEIRQARKRSKEEKADEFQVVSNAGQHPQKTIEEEEEDEKEAQQLEGMSDGAKKRVQDARALIKAGMGKQSDDSGGFQVVPAGTSNPLPKIDDREYTPENEDYDSDDQIQTLALATMMLRRSKAKKLVDASYNRYAWNDPSDLPDWFLDDETKNYRPALPIPAELIAKLKEKQILLAEKPIAKVAEARARKNRMARSKLSAAKKKAESVANNGEMTEAMKLRAISKAMRGEKGNDTRPGRKYVVSMKGGASKGGKGIKLVDKRERSDKRGLERATNKKKNGKKGGLTGSKKRRQHS